MKNIDPKTVEGFGHEWASFDQKDLTEREREKIFNDYFAIFPWDHLPGNSVGADVGCGSGRWASVVAPKVGFLHLVDASDKALDVARNNLRDRSNCNFICASVAELPFEDQSLDFAYSLGVLHHVPDTAAAIVSISEKMKSGAPLLLYIYYAFDNRSWWYKTVWKLSDICRQVISALPFAARNFVCQIIASSIYWPLARSAKIIDSIGVLPSSWPLAYYRDKTFYVMRTDALDRFGTRLEQRFTRDQIEHMFRQARIRDIRFSDHPPYWCAVGFKE